MRDARGAACELVHSDGIRLIFLPRACYFERMRKSVISRDKEILGGTPVFAGTRVPIQTLFDFLEAGDSIEKFLDGFPSVRRRQVIALLEELKERALKSAA
jgi:uncharacterized protein (DUF433 family)